MATKPVSATKKDNTAKVNKAPQDKASLKQPAKKAAPSKPQRVEVQKPAPKAAPKAAPKTETKATKKPTPVLATAPSKNTAADVKARKEGKEEKVIATKKPTKVVAVAPSKNTTAEVKARKEEQKAKEAEVKAAQEAKAKEEAKEKKAAKTTSTGKTIYHVSKRGETKADRVWKVFIQGSDKVIKLFDTQQEALDYAKQLADNKNDGSTVMLHGLDGKIRKY